MKARYFWPALGAGLLLLIFAVRGSQQIINVGGSANDGTGDTLRSAFEKVNSNFTELYSLTFTNGAVGAGNGIVKVGTNLHFATNAAYTEGRIPYANATNGIGFNANLNWDNDNTRLLLGSGLGARFNFENTTPLMYMYAGGNPATDFSRLTLDWDSSALRYRLVAQRAGASNAVPLFLGVGTTGVVVNTDGTVSLSNTTNKLSVASDLLHLDGVPITGGGGSPGGSSSEMQFRAGAATFGGATNFLYDTTFGLAAVASDKDLHFRSQSHPFSIGVKNATFTGVRDDMLVISYNQHPTNTGTTYARYPGSTNGWIRMDFESKLNAIDYHQMEHNLDFGFNDTNISWRVVQCFVPYTNALSPAGPYYWISADTFAIQPPEYPYTSTARMTVDANQVRFRNMGTNASTMLSLPNDRLIAWLDNSESTTNQSFLWMDTTNGLNFGSANISRIRLAPWGYVGFGGERSPSYVQDIAGDVRIQSSGFLRFGGTTTNSSDVDIFLETPNRLSLTNGNLQIAGLTASLPVLTDANRVLVSGTIATNMISTNGATLNQVLAFNGTTVAWQTDQTGGAGSVFVNASSVSSPNFLNTSNVLWTVTSATNVNGFVTNVSSSQIEDATIVAGDLANDAVTFAKMQNITSDRLLGRDTAASGDTEEITVGGNLEFTGSGGIQRSALTGVVTASAGSGTTAFGTFASADLATALTDENGTGPFVLSTAANLTNAVTVTSFQLVNATGPTTDASGEIAIDTNADGTTFTNPVVQFFASGNNHNLYPVEGTPTDGQIVSYQASTKRLIFAADQTGGAGSVYVDAASISSPNFQSNSNFTFTVTSVTNVNITSTNVGFLNATNQTWAGTNNFNKQINVNTGSTNSGQIVISDTNATPNTLTLTIPQSITSYTFKWPATNGTAGQVMTNDGSGNMNWGTAGSGTPGGANTQVQVNSNGVFYADAGMTYDGGTKILNLTNTVQANTGQFTNLTRNGSTVMTNRVGVYRTIWLDASAFISTTTNGATASTYTAAGADNLTKDVWMFNDAQTNIVQVGLMMPDEWDRSTVKAKVFWTATTGSGNVVWQIAGGVASDDDALGAVIGTYVTVTDAFILANDQHVSAATAAVTVGGTPALGDFVVFALKRDAIHASDTFSAAAQLFGVAIQYKESETEQAQW